MFLLSTLISLLLTLTLPAHVGAEVQRFTFWFPRYGSALTNLTHGSCSAEYAIYTSNARQNATAFPKLEAWDVDSVASPLIDCLVEKTPDIYKSAIASAQVMLGLMPSILVSVGPSIHETSILFLYGERHLLGFLILLGSPSVLFDNINGFRQQVTDIMTSEDNISMSLLIGPNVWTLWAEYLLVLAAIANVGELCYEIGVQSVTSITQSVQYLPGIWIFVGVFTHILGASIFGIIKDRPKRGSLRQAFSVLNWWEWARKQFLPARRIEKIELKFLPCSLQEVILSWFTGVIGTVNLVWGSVIFSSLLFISIKDALTIVLRFMGSAIVCRAIARYEICVIRDATTKEEQSVSLHNLNSSHDQF